MISQKVAEEILKTRVEPDIVLPLSRLSDNRYFYVPAHPEFYSHFKSKGYLYVFVHPGFLADSFIKEKEYKMYFNNIRWLNEKLRENNEPIMKVLEKDVLLGKKRIHKTFYPKNQELLLITEFGDPKLSEFIETAYGRVEINPKLVYLFLKKTGVEELRFSGELVGEEGCLKHVAEGFHNNGFRVRGVKDCIYPIIPYKKDNKILKMLYDDMIIPKY